MSIMTMLHKPHFHHLGNSSLMLLPSSFCCQICQNKENMIKSQYLVVDGLKNMTELQELGQYYYSIKTLSQILVQAEINILMVTILTQCRTDSAEPRTLH